MNIEFIMPFQQILFEEITKSKKILFILTVKIIHRFVDKMVKNFEHIFIALELQTVARSYYDQTFNSRKREESQVTFKWRTVHRVVVLYKVGKKSSHHLLKNKVFEIV